MSGPRIGELFAGYGGLGMGVQAVYGGDIAWVSEVDKGALKILGHRFPGVPNHGDITKIDWATVEPVDILTGGSPCQDLSHAGRRAGMTEGTRSNLWVAMREAIAQLRPPLVVWENVRGANSAAADSALGSDPGLLASVRRRDGEPLLRALGRVLGDLSELGYDCRWHGIRAADIGAPHGRFRYFVIAAGAQHSQLERVGQLPGLRGRYDARPDVRLSGLRHGLTEVCACGWSDTEHDPAEHRPAPALLPTPAVNDMGAGKTVEAWDEWTADMQAKHGNGNGHGKSLAIEAQRLLPTPTTLNRTSEKAKTGRTTAGPSRGGPSYGLEDVQQWGDYAAAIARWELTLGRPAPAPTQTSSKGNPQLAPTFVEWMMGLPAGWVTDVPGITRNEALKALGNGVVPQQAAEALRVMASWEVAA